MKPRCGRWKGAGKKVWALKKHEGRMRKEEGGRVRLLPYPLREVSRPNSLPFRTLTTQARDNQVIL